MPLTIYLILRSAVRRVSPFETPPAAAPHGEGPQDSRASGLPRRALECQEGAEDDLLAVEVQAVGLGEEAHGLFPHLNPLIKRAAGGEAAHAVELAADDLARAVPLAPIVALPGRHADHAGAPL